MSKQIYKLILDTDRRELEARGTPMFPCGGYFCDLNNYVANEIPWHWHEEIEVLIVRSGTIHVSLNGMDFTLQKGEGAFINSNVLHLVQLVGDADCTLNSLVFHANLISGTTESVFEQRYVRPLLGCNRLPGIPFNCNIEWQCQALQCIQEAIEGNDMNNFGYELIVREKLSRMWYLIVNNMQSVLEQPSQTADRDSERINTMLNFLHQHYTEPLELQQIAATANISERECLRCFQKTIKMAPIQYLLKYRVSVSARLLADTDAPITEICNQIGFDSPSYFSKIFKRFLSLTPTAYRKRQRK